MPMRPQQRWAQKKAKIQQQHEYGIHTDCDRKTCDHWQRIAKQKEADR